MSSSSSITSSSSPLNLTPTESYRTIFRLTVTSYTTRLNLFGFWLTAFFAITFFVYTSANSAFVLSDFLGVSEGKGDAAGSLSFYDEIAALFFVVIWGTLSDRLGRRLVYGTSFAIMGVAILGFTRVTNVYPELLLFRLLFSVGSAGCSSMLTAVLGDIAGGSESGILSGIVGLCSGFGALFSVFFLVRLPTYLSPSGSPAELVQALRDAHYITGSFAIFVGAISWFMLRPSPNAPIYVNRTVEPIGTELRNLVENARKGAAVGWSDAKVALAFAGGLLARGDSVIVGLFMPLWVNSWYIQQGLCLQDNPTSDSSTLKTSCREAYKAASALTGVAQTAALIGAPIFGILASKLPGSGTTATAIASALGITGSIGFGFMESPVTIPAYVFAAIVGLGQIGMIVTSLSLVTQARLPSNLRGSVAGVYSFFGAVGILITTKLGGVLFDVWREGGPFVVLGGLHGIVLLFSLGVLIRQQGKVRSDTDINDEQI